MSILNIFRFKSKDDQVTNHWVSFAPDFSLSPDEFYAAIEKTLQDRKIPGLEVSRVDYTQGGLLSDKRTYLRLVREQLAFDVCAAPFGQDFFFSCRTILSVPLLNIWHVLLALIFFALVNLALLKPLGPVLGGVAVLTLLLAILVMFHNAAKAEFAFLDTLLLQIPVAAPLYWVLCRRETYYREDTRMMYMEIVPKIIQEHLDEVTAAKGVKLVRQYERAPVFGDLYKPLPPKPEPKP
jgi:hypothetical protein